jgi:hypothetical protein
METTTVLYHERDPQTKLGPRSCRTSFMASSYFQCNWVCNHVVRPPHLFSMYHCSWYIMLSLRLYNT